MLWARCEEAQKPPAGLDMFPWLLRAAAHKNVTLEVVAAQVRLYGAAPIVHNITAAAFAFACGAKVFAKWQLILNQRVAYDPLNRLQHDV